MLGGGAVRLQGIAPPGHSDSELLRRAAVGIVAGGEGELGHRLGAALPLRGALADPEGEEDVLSFGFAGRGRGLLTLRALEVPGGCVMDVRRVNLTLLGRP